MSTETPTIETERLILRGWSEDDVPAIASIFESEDHARYIGGTMDANKVWRMIASFIGHQALRGYTLFAVEEKASGDCIGWAGPWYPQGWIEQEIGYSLVPSATGKGYAREAVIASVAHAYSTLGWETAVSNIDPDNEASQKLAASLGARAEGGPQEMCGYTVQLWRHLPPKNFMERFA